VRSSLIDRWVWMKGGSTSTRPKASVETGLCREARSGDIASLWHSIEALWEEA